MSARDLYPPKSEWGDGPWQDEPDEIAWSYGDVACRIVRHPYHGQLNGYVGIPRGHPWYGQENNDIDADVHGGLTFAGEFGIAWGEDTNGCTYLTETHATRTDKLWYVGFDTHHFMDLAPGMAAMERRLRETRPDWPLMPDDLNGTYRELEYVRREVEDLARQAIGAFRVGQNT